MQHNELAEWISRSCRGPIVKDIIGSPAGSLSWIKMVQNPELLEEIARHMAFRGFIPVETKAIVGIANKGASVGEALARCYGLPYFRMDIKNGLVRMSPEYDNLCIVDDTFCSGKSMEKANRLAVNCIPAVRVVGQIVVILERLNGPENVKALFKRTELSARR